MTPEKIHPTQSPIRDSGLLIFFKVLSVILVSGLAGFLSAKKLSLGLVPASVIASCMAGVGIYAVLKLQGAPREVGLTFGLKFLSVTAYKILNVTLVLWMINDFGFSEKTALGFITGWSLVLTAFTVLAGSITDALGLRRTLLIGVSFCVATRLAMVVTQNPTAAFLLGLFPLAIGEALSTPVLVAALRRYTAPAQRSVAFSLFYALMNFGFLVGYFVFDGVREYLKANGGLVIPFGIGELSPYRTLFLVSLLVDTLMWPVVFALRARVEMTDSGLVEAPQAEALVSGNAWQAAVNTTKEAALTAARTLAALFRSEGFYRLLVFLIMIGFLKIVFNVMDFVLPRFAILELGDSVRVGRFNAVNGILILVLAPAVGVWTRRKSAYSMVILGGFITALSFVFIVLPPDLFRPLADGWLGRALGNGYMELEGPVHPYYVMIILWQVLFSVGEAFYSPRVYEYAASIAPRGQEASYSSLSYIPLLFGKLVTGAAFGGLLEKYCPVEGRRDPSTMWLIIGLMVLVAPTVLLLLSRRIQVQEQGRGG